MSCMNSLYIFHMLSTYYSKNSHIRYFVKAAKYKRFLSRKKICKLIDKIFLLQRVYYALYNAIIICDVVRILGKKKFIIRFTKITRIWLDLIY